MQKALVCAALLLCTSWARADSAVHPIVEAHYGYLLGGSKSGKWISAQATARTLQGGEAYKVYGASTLLGATTGSKARSGEDPCGDTNWVTLKKNYNGTVALGATWNAVPRKLRPQNVNNRFYRREVARLLKAHGISKPRVVISQLWRVDLDGDGKDEVLLSATNYKSTERPQPNYISSSAGAGDYSVVLLRKVVERKVKTMMLAAEYYPQRKTFSAPNTYKLAGVLDANGDGKMEVILRSQYYEGDAVSLLEVNGSSVKTVASSGCGA